VSRLVKPLDHRIVWSTGDLILWAELDLLLKDTLGNWHGRTFRVDSASEITTFPAHEAKRLRLTMPQSPSPGLIHEQTGLAVRSGYLMCQIVGMDQTEYRFPCFFIGDPDTPPPPATPSARLPRCLLGLSGVIDQIRWTLHGTPTGLQAPHGNLMVEKI
jgi:hypothetical protein